MYKLTIAAILASSVALSAQTCTALANTSLSFDGIDDYVEVPFSPALTGFVDFTFEVWFRSTGFDSSSGYSALISKWNHLESNGMISTSAVRDYSFGVLRSQNQDSFRIETHAGIILTAPTTVVGSASWHHVAVTRTASTTMIILDGVVLNTGTFSSVLGSASTIWPTRIGISQAFNNLTGKWVGNIDEVRMWNVGRSLADIQSHRFLRLTGNETGLVGYWRLDQYPTPSQDQIVGDLSPTGAHGHRGATCNSEASDPTWDTLSIAPLAYPPPLGAVGQPNSIAARLEVNGVGTGTSQGPFVVYVVSGGTVTFSWTGSPLQPCTLFAGPLNPANTVSALIGTLDIGTPCGAQPYGDVIVLFDGNALPPLSLFVMTNAAGVLTQSFSLPVGLPSGSLISVQGLMGTTMGFPLRLTAAFDIVF